MVERRHGVALAGGLFMAFAALAAVSGWLALKACGLQLPGFGLVLDACPVPPAAPAGPTVEESEALRGAALAQELAHMERRLSLAPACPPAASAPPPPPRPQAALEPPPQPQSPPPPPPKPASRPVCQVQRSDSVVLMLDVSTSMKISYDAPAELERRFTDLGRQVESNPLLRILYGSELNRLGRQLEEVPGRARIELAKEALHSLVDAADPAVSFDFVTFATCGPPRVLGHYPSDRRPVLKQEIDQVSLRSSTALAQAIQALPAIIRRPSGRGDGHINVVLVSDGFDSCGGDPCAAAAAVERERPEININVVAVSRGIEELRCVAQNTGGRFFQPKDTSQIAAILRAAAGQATAEPCP